MRMCSGNICAYRHAAKVKKQTERIAYTRRNTLSFTVSILVSLTDCISNS